MQRIILYLILFTFIAAAEAQQFSVSGKVYDKGTHDLLYFANIRVLNSSLGTTSNRNGSYELKLKGGTHRLTVSYIGYISDTVSLDLDRDLQNVNFELTQTKVVLAEIVVRPGENPAIPII
ncbi:MAG: carboxypeptidase-like regulatory domain-containing protein, partial [Ignavibacteriaceae bacterium]|nr:carboxypeptidase-like regulatory domain-containing protein [Ignavibacteriaceae bacterium]